MSKPVNALATLVATACGLGYLPFARGTFGSLGALAVAGLLAHHHGWGRIELAALAAATLVPAVWSADVLAGAMNRKDPSRVVIDEVAGQWIALAGAAARNWKAWLAAFLLFRLFDIWKPFPVRQAEALPGGLGIVADDVVAGLYAAVVLAVAGWFNLY